MRPRALRLVKDGNALRWYLRVVHKEITILMDNLDKGGGLALNVFLVNALSFFLELCAFVPRQSLLQHLHQWIIPGKENCRLHLFPMRMVNGQIQANQSFPRPGNACHETNRLLATQPAPRDNRIQCHGRSRQVLGSRIASRDRFNPMPKIQCLRGLHNRWRRAIGSMFPPNVIQRRFIRISLTHLSYPTRNRIGIAPNRLQNTIAANKRATHLLRPRRNQQRNQQGLMAGFLKMMQIQRIITDLIQRRHLITLLTTLKLEKKDDIAVQHHYINPLTPARNDILKQNAPFPQRRQLPLQNLNLLAPRTLLLKRRLRTRTIGIEHAQNLVLALRKKSHATRPNKSNVDSS